MSNLQSRKSSASLFIFLLIALILGAGFAFYYFYENFSSSAPHSTKKYVVAVSQIIDISVLNEVHQGIKDGVEQSGLKIGRDIEWLYENAQGNIATSAQIAKKFISKNPNVIVGISTPSAQTLASSKTSIPLVFAAVNDPISSKLLKSLEKPAGNITGATDNPPVEKNIELISKILPHAKKLGLLYNSAEPNSTALVEKIQQEASKFGLSIEVAIVSKTSEALSSTRHLIDKVDALLFPLDNTVTTMASSIVKLASAHKIPVFALDPALIKEGILASIGVSEYQGGVEAGKIVARILKGENPGDIAVVSPQSDELHLNHEKAKELNIPFPESLKPSS